MMAERDDSRREPPITPEEFRATLEKLLERGYRSSLVFDRAWSFRYADEDHPDWTVEITELRNQNEEK